MSRLIDADKLLNKIDAYMCGSQDVMFVKELIKEQPTAFNVDKVVEKLEELSHCDWIEVRKEEVFEIVKAGEADENKEDH